MLRSLRLAVAATLALAIRAEAQHPASDSADVLIFSGSFTAGSREFTRIFLQKGQVYRAEINLGQVTFSIRPRHPGGEPPTTARIRGGLGSGESVYEIYPYQDDEYEMTVADFPEGETVSLSIYRDIVASRRRQGIAKTPGSHWYLGIEVGYASHGSYRISVTETDPDRASGDLEGCITLRPSNGAFSACLLGVTQHSGKRAVDVLWLYVEPRYALIRGGGLTRPELGVSLRGGFGSNQQTGSPPFDADNGANPALFGVGAYAKVWPQGTPGAGFSLGVSVQYIKLLGVQDLSESFGMAGVNIGFAF